MRTKFKSDITLSKEDKTQLRIKARKAFDAAKVTVSPWAAVEIPTESKAFRLFRYQIDNHSQIRYKVAKLTSSLQEVLYLYRENGSTVALEVSGTWAADLYYELKKEKLPAN